MTHMPHPDQKKLIKLFDQRVAIARMMTRAIRDFHGALCHDRFGKEPEMVLIGAVIVEGMARGRPRSKSDISRLTGIARTTLRRRLVELEHDGQIIRAERGFVARAAAFNAPERINMARSLSDGIVQLGKELAKLADRRK